MQQNLFKIYQFDDCGIRLPYSVKVFLTFVHFDTSGTQIEGEMAKYLINYRFINQMKYELYLQM